MIASVSRLMIMVRWRLCLFASWLRDFSTRYLSLGTNRETLVHECYCSCLFLLFKNNGIVPVIPFIYKLCLDHVHPSGDYSLGVKLSRSRIE